MLVQRLGAGDLAWYRNSLTVQSRRTRVVASTNNPYAAPASDVQDISLRPSPLHKMPMYSPSQVFGGAFFGGPIALVYFLHRNFLSLGQESEAKTTLVWGVVFNVAVLAALPFLPDKFPNSAIPISYAIFGRYFAQSKQLTKEAIASSGQFTFQSNWRVFCLALLSLLAWCAIGIPMIFALVYFGVISGA
jgi:hypothetical protein